MVCSSHIQVEWHSTCFTLVSCLQKFEYLTFLYKCTGRSFALPHGIGCSIGIGCGVSVSKILKFYEKVLLYDGQGTVRRAVLYIDRSCLFPCANLEFCIREFCDDVEIKALYMYRISSVIRRVFFLPKQSKSSRSVF